LAIVMTGAGREGKGETQRAAVHLGSHLTALTRY